MPAEAIRRSARRWQRAATVSLGLTILLLWTGLAVHLAFERKISIDAAVERDRNLVLAVDHYAVRVFRNAEAVNLFVGSTLRPGMPTAELQQVVDGRAAANDALDEVGACLPDARIVASDPQSGITPTLCQALNESMARHASHLLIGPLTPARAQQFIPLASPIRDGNGQLAAVVVSLVRPETLLGVLQSTSFRHTAFVALVEERDRVIASWDSQRGYVVSPPPVAELLTDAGPDIAGRFLEAQGSRMLVTQRPMAQFPLRVMLATAEEDILAAYWQRRSVWIAAATLTSLLLAGLGLLLGRQQQRTTELSLSLGEAHKRLEQLNANLETQVLQRTEALQQANKDLESFSYTVAHDVRAPLASIRGFADALAPAVKATGDAKQVHYLDRILANASQMSQLTEQLLELGKIKRRPLQPVPVDLSAMAREIVDSLQEREPGRDVRVRIEPTPMVHADRVLIRQLLDNLLGNAFKFTARRQPAAIAFGLQGVDDDGAVFFVRDNGAGFEAKAAIGLFEPFHRMHAANEFPGTGVGLATAHRILQLHGGAIWCESQPERGATFFFRLPSAPSGKMPTPSASGSTP